NSRISGEGVVSATSVSSHSATSFHGTAGSSEQGCFFIGDHLHRNSFQQCLQAALAQKTLHKHGAGQLGKNSWGNAASKENAAGCLALEGEVAGLGAVHLDPEIKRLLGERAFAAECDGRIRRNRIAPCVFSRYT